MTAERIKNKAVRHVLICLVLTAVYLIVSVPFKMMEIIPGFTDIRSVPLLQPVYGIFFGIPGCLAFAFGNLFADIIGNSLRLSSIAGFAANFLGPVCFYLFWRVLSRKPFRLDTPKQIGKHLLLIVISAALEALVITPFVVLWYPDVNAVVFFVTVLINGTAFPTFIGIPLIILIQEELRFTPMTRPKLSKNRMRDEDNFRKI